MLLLAKATTYAEFTGLLGSDETRAVVAIKHAVDFYVAQARGTQLTSHFRKVLDLATGQADALSATISKAAIIQQMKDAMPGVVIMDFCSACRTHGHTLKNCPAKIKLDTYFKLNKAQKAIWGQQKGIAGKKRPKAFMTH